MFQASTPLCTAGTINTYKILPRVTVLINISLAYLLTWSTPQPSEITWVTSPVQMRNRLKVFRDLPKAFPLSNKVQNQASCLQVHKNSAAHTASLWAVCNLCGKNLILNWITETFPNPTFMLLHKMEHSTDFQFMLLSFKLCNSTHSNLTQLTVWIFF